MSRNLKEQILNLRVEGRTYEYISKELKCSLGTVGYHLLPHQKAKTIEKSKHRKLSFPLLRKLDHFRNVTKSDSTPKPKVSEDELRKMFPPVCYLTGRSIDYEDTASYNLDHVIPNSKGGSNSLDNCGLACKSVNQAKSDLSVEEFFQLCIDVVKHNNLKIE
jgi:hypothetical protein